MNSPVSICNMALRRLGVRGITSLDERSVAAEKCKEVYPQMVDVVLRDHDWGFATKTQAPGLVNESVIGWDYLYKTPSDCLKPRKVYTEASYGLDTPEPFVERLSPITGTKVIATNLAEATLEYTHRVTNVNLFDVAFTEALAWRIAAELANDLTSKVGNTLDFMKVYAATLAQAKFLDENAKYENPKNYCDYIDGR